MPSPWWIGSFPTYRITSGTRLRAREQARRDHPPGWDLLYALFELRMRFATEHPELHQLVFDRPVPGFVPSDASMEDSYALREAGRQILESVIEAGVITSRLAPDHARDLLLAMMHGLTALHIANEPEAPAGSGRFGALIGEAVDVFHRACEPETAQRREVSMEE